MPPGRNRQPPAHNLSWFSAHRRWVAVRSVSEIDAHNRRLLERFRHHVRVHDIPYFQSSHQDSLYSGRTRASISGPPSAAYLRSTTCRGKLKYPPTTFRTSAVSVLESTRPTLRSALPINGPLSTSSQFQDRVDVHAAKLFFGSALSRNRSRNRSLTRKTWSRIATRTTQCLILARHKQLGRD